jgi:NAD-dependent dihydropyrimidine dehydrogenase PreA subunit
MDAVYVKLAKHLDNLPAGFPATDSGVELRILKRLFTPQEAEVAMGLTLMPEPASTVAQRLGQDEPALASVLEKMSKKGLILRSNKGGQNNYMAAQFVVGIWEYHVNDLNEDLIRDFNEYVPFLVKELSKQKTQQLRVIPVSQSVSAEMRTMPYEEAEQIIKNQSKIVVADCICRKEHQIAGKGCDNPLESCLMFSGAAYYYEDNGLGRSIDQEEALEILNKGIEAGLVLQPANSQKPSAICMCCGCCCQILKNVKQLDKPAQIVNTNYYVAVNEEDCVACGTCEDRCQMDAITVDDVAHVDRDQCIGCGLCIPTCDTEAIKLFEKSEEEKWIPPKTVVETYLNIAKERGKI